VGNLQVKDVPEELHMELRRRAGQVGMTVRDYVLDLIRRDQALPSRQDWLDSLRGLKPVPLDRPAADIIRGERRARAAGAGRR
jgi:hypothetical protein